MEDKIIVLDLETTNFFNRGGLIVEIGIVKLHLESGIIEPIYEAKVKEKTFDQRHKNSWIFLNTDLKFDDIIKARDLEKDKIQNILKEYKVISWNTAFDFAFLKDRGFIFKGLPCPMKQSTNYFKIPNYRGYKYPSVQEAWNLLFPKSNKKEKHRALDDTIVEAKIIHKLYENNVLIW